MLCCSFCSTPRWCLSVQNNRGAVQLVRQGPRFYCGLWIFLVLDGQGLERDAPSCGTHQGSAGLIFLRLPSSLSLITSGLYWIVPSASAQSMPLWDQQIFQSPSAKGSWELCLQPLIVDLRLTARIPLQEKICCLGSGESGQQIASGLTTPSGSPSAIKRHLSQGHALPRATLSEVGCKDLTNSADWKTMLMGNSYSRVSLWVIWGFVESHHNLINISFCPILLPPFSQVLIPKNILPPKLCLSIYFQRSQLTTLILSFVMSLPSMPFFSNIEINLCRLFPKAFFKRLTFKFSIMLHIQKAYFEHQKLYTRSFFLSAYLYDSLNSSHVFLIGSWPGS